MPSLIPGYNYDIFISYRQKDNKGDRWVSQFVEALKTELEATFKEDVSVYFDENPHDRLQESHDVGKSLEGKLKCLLFIPVISQTYCDPKSYAWQYEFIPFLRMAENDSYGMDVRLKSGNVASRILPVRIHDLEEEDIELYRKETGKVLRAIDFVFKTTAGVIRPLLPDEDHPNDNLNKTFYRDQINKAAHAIKEIITGLKGELIRPGKEVAKKRAPVKPEIEKPETIVLKKSFRITRQHIIPGAVIIMVLAALVLTNLKIFKKDKFETLRDSEGRITVAVMPFRNMTGDTTKNIWQNWLQDIMTGSLTSSKELKVRQTESIEKLLEGQDIANYASLTPALASNLSRKLDANIFLLGNFIITGPKIRVSSQLIDSKTEEVLKYFQIESDLADGNILPIIDTLSMQVKNYLLISKLKETNKDFQSFTTTNSAEAYRYYNIGQNAFSKLDYPTAVTMLSKAVNLDSSFFWARLLLAEAYGNQFNGDTNVILICKRMVRQLYGVRDRMPTILKIYAEFSNSWYNETPLEQIKYLNQILAIDDQLPNIYWQLGSAYTQLDQYEKAIPPLERSLEIYEKWGIKPWWVSNYWILGDSYYKTGQYEKEKELLRKADEDFPDNLGLLYRKIVLYLAAADTVTASQLIEKYKVIRRNSANSEEAITRGLGNIYRDACIPGKAEEFYRRALLLAPESGAAAYSLGRLLIDNDLNINEGLELIDRALKVYPGDYFLIHWKGWGLFKLGKYQDALDYLQKSWDLRKRIYIYDHTAFLHLEEAKKALASQKNN